MAMILFMPGHTLSHYINLFFRLGAGVQSVASPDTHFMHTLCTFICTQCSSYDPSFNLPYLTNLYTLHALPQCRYNDMWWARWTGTRERERRRMVEKSSVCRQLQGRRNRYGHYGHGRITFSTLRIYNRTANVAIIPLSLYMQSCFCQKKAQ